MGKHFVKRVSAQDTQGQETPAAPGDCVWVARQILVFRSKHQPLDSP